MHSIYSSLESPCRLPIHHNWTFFVVSYGWDVTSGNLSKSAFFEWGGSLWAQISDGRGRRPPTTVGVRKLRVIAISCGIKISAMHCMVLWQSTHVTNRKTHRQSDRITTTPKTALP